MRKHSLSLLGFMSLFLLLMLSCTGGSTPVTTSVDGENDDDTEEIIAIFEAINPSLVERNIENHHPDDPNHPHDWWDCQSFFGVDYGITVWKFHPDESHHFARHGIVRIRDSHCDLHQSKVMVALKIGKHPGHVLHLPAMKNINDAGENYHGAGEHTWGSDLHYGGTEWELNLHVAPCDAIDSKCIEGTLTILKWEAIQHSPTGPVIYTEKNWEIVIDGHEIH